MWSGVRSVCDLAAAGWRLEVSCPRSPGDEVHYRCVKHSAVLKKVTGPPLNINYGEFVALACVTRALAWCSADAC